MTAEPATPGTATSGPRVVRSLVTILVGNVGVLALNLATGVLSARLLEPEGRGTFAAVSVFVVVVALLGQNGLADAGTFFLARQPERARSIASTCAVMLLGLATLSTILGLLVVPYVFAAQPDSTVDLARLAVLATGAVMGREVALGLVAGLGRFGHLAAYRLCQPLIFLIGLVVLAVTGRATAGSALAVFFGAYAVVAALVLSPLVLGRGRRLPDRSLAGSLAGYGVRLQGQVLGDVGNTRLDLVVLPAVVVAAQIGLYSVAVSVASIVIALFATLGGVLSPLASTGDRTVAMRLVERTTRMVLVAAALCAVVLAVLAPWLVRLVYGEDYTDSVGPLRLLLPGCVFWGSSQLLAGGLRAMGRPGATSLAQLAGLVATVAGLAATLPRFGIAGAAVTSSVAYFLVFLLMALLLSGTSPFRASELLNVAELRRDVEWLARTARHRAGRGGPAAAAPQGPGDPADERARIVAVPQVGRGRIYLRSSSRKDVMPRSTRPASAWSTGLAVAVPALLGATVSGLIGLSSVEAQQRATGVVQLSEIAGNAASGQLNPYAADLETALLSAPVRERIRQAVGPDAGVGSVEVERLSDASRVSIALQSDTAEQARTALLAAGRAAYAALVEQQVQLLEVRERAALERLETLRARVTAARQALGASPRGKEAAARSAVQQEERLQSIAVDELSQVQGQLAVVQELRSGEATTTAVVVDSVDPVSRLPELLPIFSAGFIGGAIPGAALAVALRRRGRSDPAEAADRRSEHDGDLPLGDPPAAALDDLLQPDDELQPADAGPAGPVRRPATNSARG